MSNSFLFVSTVLIWGSTWFAIEFQLGSVAPEVSVVYRYLLASLILFIYCKNKRLQLTFKVKHHIWFVLMGLFMFCLNYVLAYRAQIHITSALSAIVFSAMLWLNILNARVIFGVRSGRRVLLGAAVGVAGILLVFGPQVSDVSLSDGVLFGSMLSFGGALMASFGNMVSQKAHNVGLPVVQSNAWSMLYGGILTAIIAVLAGHSFTFDRSAEYVISLLYLSVFGSVLAFGAYLTLLGRIGAPKAGYASVMFPVVALAMSMLFEGLSLTIYIVFGFVLVIVGNLLVLTDSTQPSQKTLAKDLL